MDRMDQEYNMQITTPRDKTRHLSVDAHGPVLPFFIVAGILSIFVNLLMLVSPLYMLQIYDRVLTSGSIETLFWVSVVAIGMLSAFGFIEAARRKTMMLFGEFVQMRYGPAIMYANVFEFEGAGQVQSRLGDLSAFKSFHQNGLSLPFYDLPFTPLFLLAMFLVHPLVGWLGLIGGTVLLLVTALTELGSRGSVKHASEAEFLARQAGEELVRNRNAVVSMGMAEPLLQDWSEKKGKADQLATRSSGLSRGVGSHARGFRLMLQIAALGVGAWLALQQQITAGAVIAGSILLGRALAPIDQCLGAWKHIVRARQAWKFLRKVNYDSARDPKDYTALPKPDSSLKIEGLKVSAPGTNTPLLPKFNLNIRDGCIVAILGSSGSGKSSLMNTLTGASGPADGTIRLGGRDIHKWPAHDRGTHIGYLPQDVELLPGTVSENISRFAVASDEEIIETAKSLGMHDLIVRLPDGYDTKVGAGGHRLSKGQCQAIGLMRAFYGDPSLICLDEPSSNIDQILYSGLSRCLVAAKQNGTLIFISTHDRRIVELADHVVLLRENEIEMVSSADYLQTLHSARTSTSNIERS